MRPRMHAIRDAPRNTTSTLAALFQCRRIGAPDAGAKMTVFPLTRARTPPTPSSPSQALSALFVAASLDEWMRPEGLEHNGLLVKRPFNGAWDASARQIDAFDRRIESQALSRKVEWGARPQLLHRLSAAVDDILAVAQLPEALSEQIHHDACSIGVAVGAMFPSAAHLSVRLEIFGESTCSRWHRDNLVGRAIVSYTGHVGTECIADTNVDFRTTHGVHCHAVHLPLGALLIACTVVV